jgi:cobalt-zinc-cadmium efflux system outer membrane protein
LANAHLEAVRSEVVAAEYSLAAEVRKAYVSMRSADQFVVLAEQEAALREQAATIVEQRKSLGEATALEFALVDLERAQFQRILRDARADRDSRLRALLALSGLPPNTDPELFATKPTAAPDRAPDLADDEVDAALLSARLDLRAAAAAYASSEADLALAVTKQPPRVGVGPSLRKEPGGVTSLGAAVSLEIPVFDRNEGEIAEKLAARETARAEYVALLQRRRADAFDARAVLRVADAEIRLQEQELLPQLERTEKLFDGAFESRDLTVFEWLTARNRILEARRDYLEAVTKRARATADFESAIGQPIGSREGTTKTNSDRDGSKP